ncbi:transposase, partial [Levilactobacillus parabrevis]|uniref:RNA-guided endonuclease InsQ/TnpB family protein n=2 Tax=Levilactobacillus parabrevis TaxID=357278 RepID=UPI0021A64C9B
HHVSTALIKNHDLVVAEELRSKNMLRNHALAMSISDVGWRTLLAMLSYKADLYGCKFLTVNPRNTTQTCSHCGHIMTGKNKLTLADRKWTCPNCGIFHVRDHNAAKNILAKGLALL